MPTDSCWPALGPLISEAHSVTHHSLVRRVFRVDNISQGSWSRRCVGKRENWSRKTERTCWKSHLAEQRATAPRKFLEGNAGEVSQQNSYQRQWQRFHIVVTCHPTLKKMTPLRGGTETGMVEGWAWNTSPSACSTKWNGRKMMNDKIIQQMRVRLTCDH